MRPYKYVKVDTENAFVQHHLALERGRRIVAGSMTLVGLSLMTYVGGYYGIWQLRKDQLATKPGIVDTIALSPQSAFISTASANQDPLRRADSVSASDNETRALYDSFRLSIPRLSISQAKVTTDVMSNTRDIYMPVLSSSLAHYKGSAYPGSEGNVIVYGHSILPAFYNPNNYLSIFSKLDTLQSLDTIRVTWGENVYTYRVEGMSVVKPDDTRVLQYVNGKTITLLTCVPPGLTTERLLVFGRLEE